MSYRTILVHLDKTMFANSGIDIAASIAHHNEAHLIGAAIVGVFLSGFEQTHIEDKDPALAEHLQFLTDRAQHLVDEFESAMEKAGLTTFEGRVVDGDAEHAISYQARYCDLVIINQNSPDAPHHLLAPGFLETVIVNTGSPVLIVPARNQSSSTGKRPLIAWNGSVKSTRAVNDALPILKRAEKVHVLVLQNHAKPGIPEGIVDTDIALHLARHGVNVEVLPIRKTKNVAKGLLMAADELSSDLIIMGGYGHSRLREVVLGSITNTVLAEMKIPVLMSH